jgi:hypothetical protein
MGPCAISSFMPLVFRTYICCALLSSHRIVQAELRVDEKDSQRENVAQQLGILDAGILVKTGRYEAN